MEQLDDLARALEKELYRRGDEGPRTGAVVGLAVALHSVLSPFSDAFLEEGAKDLYEAVTDARDTCTELVVVIDPEGNLSTQLGVLDENDKARGPRAESRGATVELQGTIDAGTLDVAPAALDVIDAGDGAAPPIDVIDAGAEPIPDAPAGFDGGFDQPFYGGTRDEPGGQ